LALPLDLFAAPPYVFALPLDLFAAPPCVLALPLDLFDAPPCPLAAPPRPEDDDASAQLRSLLRRVRRNSGVTPRKPDPDFRERSRAPVAGTGDAWTGDGMATLKVYRPKAVVDPPRPNQALLTFAEDVVKKTGDSPYLIGLGGGASQEHDSSARTEARTRDASVRFAQRLGMRAAEPRSGASGPGTRRTPGAEPRAKAAGAAFVDAALFS
jgi:hypothetical protein